jgi:hypothetical protein
MAKVLRIVSGIPTLVTVQDPLPAVYSQILTGQTISSGTPVTLPASRTYNSSELGIYRNGQRLLLTTHYSYNGSVPRTQVTFTFNITSTDEILFEILRDF